jgi:RNA polymerase sigma-70 factor (ECF subfamily)
MNEEGDTRELDCEDMSELAAGNELALNRLMDRHGARLLRFLSRILGDEQEAMELTQEAFVRVYKHRHRFNSKQKFTTWLYAIGSNLSRDRIRWRKRHPAIPFSVLSREEDMRPGENRVDERPAPHEQCIANEEAIQVRKAVGKLPEELKIPVILAEYEGRSHSEIALILNCSEKAVEMRLYRARKGLRARLVNILKI